MPDSQTLGLLIAAMVAGVVCFRLYTVLGRRTGHEPPPQAAPRARPRRRSRPAHPRRRPAGCWTSSSADRSFDTPKFLAGARQAYDADRDRLRRKGDRAALARCCRPTSSPLLTPASRRAPRPPPPFVKLHDARIAGAALHGREAEITVAFTAEFATGTVTDVWTFERNLDSTDPNWLLVATSGDVPETPAGFLRCAAGRRRLAPGPPPPQHRSRAAPDPRSFADLAGLERRRHSTRRWPRSSAVAPC